MFVKKINFMKKKILDLNTLSKKVLLLKNKNKKIVLSHGSFDLIHPGHINHLKKAKSYGDILIVTITADKFVNKKLQGTHYNQYQRAEFLSNFEFVDYISIINETSAITGLKNLKPNNFNEKFLIKDKNGDIIEKSENLNRLIKKTSWGNLRKLK